MNFSPKLQSIQCLLYNSHRYKTCWSLLKASTHFPWFNIDLNISLYFRASGIIYSIWSFYDSLFVLKYKLFHFLNYNLYKSGSWHLAAIVFVPYSFKTFFVMVKRKAIALLMQTVSVHESAQEMHQLRDLAW